jgi:hypothetical protein
VLPVIAHGGTHDTPDQGTEPDEGAGIDEIQDAIQEAPSEQTWFRGTLVTAENAQALFQPSACIFVAK